MVPPIRDAGFVDLILAIFTRDSGLAPGTGLESPETGSRFNNGMSTDEGKEEHDFRRDENQHAQDTVRNGWFAR